MVAPKVSPQQWSLDSICSLHASRVSHSFGRRRRRLFEYLERVSDVGANGMPLTAAAIEMQQHGILPARRSSAWTHVAYRAECWGHDFLTVFHCWFS